MSSTFHNVRRGKRFSLKLNEALTSPVEVEPKHRHTVRGIVGDVDLSVDRLSTPFDHHRLLSADS